MFRILVPVLTITITAVTLLLPPFLPQQPYNGRCTTFAAACDTHLSSIIFNTPSSAARRARSSRSSIDRSNFISHPSPLVLDSAVLSTDQYREVTLPSPLQSSLDCLIFSLPLFPILSFGYLGNNIRSGGSQEPGRTLLNEREEKKSGRFALSRNWKHALRSSKTDIRGPNTAVHDSI